MKQWISVDQASLDLDHEETIRGVHVHMSASPYDIPEAITGYYCSDRERFIIEFRYADTEPTKKESANEYTDVVKGAYTGRVYQVCIDVESSSAEQVSLVVEEQAEMQPAIDPRYSTASFDNTFERMKSTMDRFTSDSKKTGNIRAISAAIGQSRDRLKESFQSTAD